MKATIIGSDFLQKGDSVKFLEINTNTTIINDGVDYLDLDALFNVVTSNSITEFHYIWTDLDAYHPLNFPHKFEEKLKEKCDLNGITYTSHVVPTNSVTVPYIEDSPTKFILRQSFDTTALIDETYCADKFEFFNLMSGSTYIPKTFYSSDSLSMDTLSNLDLSNINEPNLVEKHRYPKYDVKTYPALYSMESETDVTNFKNGFDLSKNNLLQEFVYDESNILDGKWTVIRSIDIIYGSNLDIINLGGYRHSTVIPLSFSTNEFLTGTRQLNQKSRYKYITKELGNFAKVDYHVDDDTLILDYSGTLKDINTIQVGDLIKSIEFQDLNGNFAGAPDQTTLEAFGWDGTMAQSNSTLTTLPSTLSGVTSAEVDTIFVRITLANGMSWSDSPSCIYYIEEKDSTATRFEKVNKLYVGDKLVITDHTTSELTTVEIVGLSMEYATKTIYGLDFEPSDLFLVDIGDGLLGVMHNSCWCPWNYCGHWCHSNWCPNGCGFTPAPKI